MCGIYGAFSTDGGRPIHADVSERMAHVLAHRGPDGGGSHLAGPCGMGMRRLSIIDLASVHLYEEYGERCLEPLRGMFAFAIWDGPRRELLLGRDRLGIKPLYYAVTPSGFLFGSELNALIQSPWLRPRLDRSGLAAYLQYGYLPELLSILDGVAKVPPGHTITVRSGCPAPPRRYWQATAHFERAAASDSETQAAEDLWRKLEEAVRLHMISDVPVGAFLSGGVDSTAVVSIMARACRRPIKTFSVGFLEDRYNELPHARQVAAAYGTEHHALLVEPSGLKVLEELLSSFDEPFADSSAIPTYLRRALEGRVPAGILTLKHCHIFVLPSLSEACSNVVLEAMATGLPVVGTRVGGMPALVDEHRTGLLVPPNNAPALAEAILRLLETPAIATEMGVQGCARALVEFGMDRMHERIGSFYCRALGAVHGAPTPREAMQRP